MQTIAIMLAGLGIGFMGSFHCIGMCGPIALALPVYDKSSTERFIAIALYNIGRAITYAALGALFGFIGYKLFLTGYQQAISIVLGAIVLAALLLNHFVKRSNSFLGPFHIKVKNVLGKLLRSEKNNYSYLLIGIVNGLLPCGLVYLGIASATSTGSATGGALLMFMFGMGTFPLMFSFMVLGKHFSFSFRNRIRKWVPVFAGAMAVLLILRGLNLDIPFVSPVFKHLSTNEVIGCGYK